MLFSALCPFSNQAISAEMSICETHLVTHTTLLYRKTLLSSGRYRRSGTGILYCHLQLLESGHAIVGGLRLLSLQRCTRGMCLQVHGSLDGLSSQPVWQQEDVSASSAGALPSFSAYPQQSVTAAGEYLMMLPQTLEGLLGSGEEMDDQMDSEWLDKVKGHCLAGSQNAGWGGCLHHGTMLGKSRLPASS